MTTRFVCCPLLVLAALMLETSARHLNRTCHVAAEEAEATTAQQRHKRWLTMIPNGGICSVVFSSESPVQWGHNLVRSLVMDFNVQANYVIPAKIIWPHAENFFKERVLSVDYVDHSRKELYRILERVVQSWGGDGRECLLKTICQVAETPLRHNGLIGEILDEVFTPYNGDGLDDEYKLAKEQGTFGDVECAQLYEKCADGHDLLSGISKLVEVLNIN